MSAAIIKNGPEQPELQSMQNGFKVVVGGIQDSSGIIGLSFTGVISLSIDDYIRLFVQADADTDFYIMHESSFSAVLLQTEDAVAATTTSAMNFNETAGSWHEITSLPNDSSAWDTSASVVLFSLGSAFEASTGRFTLPTSYTADALVFASANVFLSGAEQGTFTVSLAITSESTEGTPDMSNSLQTPSAGTVTGQLNVGTSGILILQAGDSISAWISADEDVNY
eukprot:SAG11_NODE_12990_length_675_cov_1.390625_1_plen_224_part_11